MPVRDCLFMILQFSKYEWDFCTPMMAILQKIFSAEDIFSNRINVLNSEGSARWRVDKVIFILRMA